MKIGIRVADDARRLVVECDGDGFLVDWQGSGDFARFTTLAQLQATLRNIEIMADEAEGLFRRMWGDLGETAPYAGAAEPATVADGGPADDQPFGVAAAAPVDAGAAAVPPAAAPAPEKAAPRGHKVSATGERNRAAVAELHATGASVRAIAEQLGLGQSTVFGHLKALGLPTRTQEATAAAVDPFRRASHDAGQLDGRASAPGNNGHAG